MQHNLKCRSYNKKPPQLTVWFKKCTFVIFRSGKCRIMGNVCIEKAIPYLHTLLHILDCRLISPPLLVSQTIVFQLDPQYTPINLLYISNRVQDSNVRFEYECFPALSLHFWKPLHVNVFATGKVVVLGNNATNMLVTIYKYLIDTINKVL